MNTNNSKVGIKELVAISGLSENYIRKEIARGKLRATKETIGESKIEKNWIEIADYEAWKTAKAAHTRREDGRNKYVIYLTPEEFEAKQFDNGTIVRANLKLEEEAAE